ncbi:MAG TPA: response regulator transcription factor [Nitrospinaceae bacterium]|jgi:DNA-binding NarL/FixJ family response regulator|nr:DNA-binding response regulator [Nitrospinota bacterium]MDP6335544.1 response regulator transcription factor [Nitrospinaceae bacterium]MDP7148832.1 response regulator transcription factor [Nitrospinaceae bacterium]HAX46039.1 DNA-binding response regulator [Nitrospina sp.]HJO57891.1 response regulator transcription factor [Nitrospinaceae bacterium]|tara:strand:- start:5326 stop:5979 length:654 start_codon:yes stop_codon:yes gene_type:complete
MKKDSGSHQIKVLLADDHAVLRDGLKLLLSETPDIIASGEAKNGYEVLEKVRKNHFDIVVLDAAMPGLDGMETLKQLVIDQPRLPVLILTMYPEERIAARFLKAGASGFLTKDSASEELVKAIKAIFRGEKFITPKLAQKLALDFLGSDKQPHELLSDREYQVMCMMGAGKRISEIANELQLSIKTVSTHRTHILEKIKLDNNAQLIRYVIENKLIE